MPIASVSNVLSVFNHASNCAYVDGLDWYRRAHTFALSLDPENVDRAAGVIAAISPNTSWTANKTLALRAYAQGHGEGIGFKDKNAKVTRILNGEAPIDVIGGPKVTAFYYTILDPSRQDVVTIDRHAHDIAVNERQFSAKRDILGRKGGYQQFVDIYLECANIVGCGAPELQAITWNAWRERHAITV